MALTVREIADRAGVSPATVSRVINGGTVGAEKRRAVLKVLEESGSPARHRARRQGPANLGILLVTGAENDPRGVLTKFSAIVSRLPKKWNLLLLPPDILPQELEARHLRGELAGLILAGHKTSDSALIEALRNIPHIWLNSYLIGGGSETILMGNEFAGRIAARYLFEHDCRRSVVLSISSRNPGFASRVEGFRFEFFARRLECHCLELNIPASRNGFEACDDREVEEALEHGIADENFLHADGIFSPEERLTALLYRVLARRGSPPPGRIVSCNYTPEYLTGLWPRPASIDLSPRMLAELALDELLRRISGVPGRADNVAVIVSPALVEGD